MVLEIVFLILSKDGVITIARQEATIEPGWTEVDRVSGNVTEAMARAREYARLQGAKFTTAGVHWYKRGKEAE